MFGILNKETIGHIITNSMLTSHLDTSSNFSLDEPYLSATNDEISFITTQNLGKDDSPMKDSLGAIDRERKEEPTKLMIGNRAKGTILHEKLEKEVVSYISELFALYGMTLGVN